MAEGLTAIVILGGSGDLTRRKLIPALAALHGRGFIDDSTVIVGSGRTPFSDDAFREHVGATAAFGRLLHYHVGTVGLRSYLQARGSFSRIIFFLALPPAAYAATAAELAREGFGAESALIIEKPFGYDYDSARALNKALNDCFAEQQIYRIDHYLAKEAVQNILVFRFANSMFYPIWNSRYIESIQINCFEEIGVENRGAYFDSAGIIRDMVQNHLMQLLCLCTMEAPVSLDAEEIRAQKINVMKAIGVECCCRYQYEGYRGEKGVAADSTTETYAEMLLRINSFRWEGMPVFIRTGKALDRKGTEIGIRFKPAPRLLFNREGTIPPNTIIFKIQPAEGIIIDIASKLPGTDVQVRGTNLTFCFRDAFGPDLPEAYQRLLLDVLHGDRTLFVSAEETETSWRILQPALDRGELKYYRRGTVPPACLGEKWIDFDKYALVCQRT